MSNRDWRDDNSIVVQAVIVFLLIFGMIGYFLGEDVGRGVAAKVNAEKQHDDTPDRINRACVNASNADLAECVDDAIKTSGEYQRAEYDLAAQQIMADWAKWMLIVSIVGVGVTVIGVIYVRNTLEETRRTNAIAREIGEAQVRAYISVIPDEVIVKAGDVPSGLKIKIHNMGNSPARQVRITAAARWQKNDGAFSHANDKSVSLKDLASGEDFVHTVAIKGSDWDNFLVSTEGEDSGLFAYGVIVYYDVFHPKKAPRVKKDERETKFRLLLSMEGTFSFCEGGNGTT